MFRSLRFRMAASHASVLAIILLALGGGGYLLLARSLDHAVTNELLAAARQHAHRIEEIGRAVPPPDSDVPSQQAVQVAVFTPEGAPFGEPLEMPAWLRPSRAPVVDLKVEGEDVRSVTVPARRGAILLASVVAGRSLEPEERLLHRVRLLLLAGGGAAIGLSLVAGWWLAGRAARPVERAYEAQAGFAADASHELRTPLAFVRSGVEVLAERDPELGAQVLTEIDYLTGLTQRLLALARAERGQLVMDLGPIDVAMICRSAAGRIQATSGIRLTLEGDEVIAVGDRVATEAALDAVLENVGVHGGGEAILRWGSSGGRSLIRLEDHGPGLSKELSAQAFERFTRADRSRTRATGGAGLGLALARALVEAQGGSMWLEETPGGGLTATIALATA